MNAMLNTPAQPTGAIDAERERLAKMADTRAWISADTAEHHRRMSVKATFGDGTTLQEAWEKDAADWRTIAAILRGQHE